MKTMNLRGLNSLELKIIAMIFMVLDHMWATVIPGAEWMTCVGRLTFPIFAFQIAEGYAHTRDPKAYRRRLLLWALVSEIPFNLMMVGGPIYPFDQNVMFTFWLALVFLGRIDRARARKNVLGYLAMGAWTVLAFWVGTLTMVDYKGEGVLMVILFYLTRDLPWGKLAQLAGMLYINTQMIRGQVYPVELFGMDWNIPRQGFAVLALLLIWLYNGEQGPYNKTIRRACYAFYPVHILILALLGLYIVN